MPDAVGYPVLYLSSTTAWSVALDLGTAENMAFSEASELRSSVDVTVPREKSFFETKYTMFQECSSNQDCILPWLARSHHVLNGVGSWSCDQIILAAPFVAPLTQAPASKDPK